MVQGRNNWSMDTRGPNNRPNNRNSRYPGGGGYAREYRSPQNYQPRSARNQRAALDDMTFSGVSGNSFDALNNKAVNSLPEPKYSSETLLGLWHDGIPRPGNLLQVEDVTLQTAVSPVNHHPPDAAEAVHLLLCTTNKLRSKIILISLSTL